MVVKVRLVLIKCETKKCSWAYMGLGCGYTGGLLECDGTLEDCKRHNNIRNFGGFLKIKEAEIDVQYR